MTPRAISAAELMACWPGAGDRALIDVREPVEAERGHILGACNLPRRLIEFRMAGLLPDQTAPITVVDDASGRAPLAAHTLVGMGYADVTWLDGGLPAWQAAGGTLVSGSNVPSKAFGERVQHAYQVPAIDARSLHQLQQSGTRLLVLDVRTPEEHRQACIPGAVSAPSFDHILHGPALADAHELVVLHCAGRTRSIVATRTWIELGLQRVVALENGTMGWRLAGLGLEQGSQRSLGPAPDSSREAAAQAAAALASTLPITRLSTAELARRLAAHAGNQIVFDVRSLAEYRSGHIPGSIALPGGQAVQRTDDFVARRQTALVLVDDGDARAQLTAVWLSRMGYPDVAVLVGGVPAWRAEGRALATGREHGQPADWSAALAAAAPMPPEEAARLLAARPDLPVIDVGTSARHRRGHVPGARWLPRGWLEQRLHELPPPGDSPLLVSCEDGRQSVYAALALRRLGHVDALALAGGAQAWAAAGFPLATATLPPQDDELLPPYARGEQAMRDYIDWEKLLVPGPPADAASHDRSTP